MVSIKINGLEFLSKPSISVLEACKNAGITIPRFCYHEILSISGNCRMCLVEIENMEKPVASCVTEVEENMSIKVDSPFVKKARENVLEALLLNHPLDCPICDQAGECDLQDQTKTFGTSHSRFFFNKKTVEDKYCGPLIKTIMTRCITCTRCVRYAEEVAGINYFGTLNRGLNTEIGSYIPKAFESEISGNVIDLCPVGALTSKPYAFKARPWELRLTESLDVTDSFGSNIYLNYKESEILRILPKSNSEINSSLISDKTRFSYDSNNISRIKNVHIYNQSKENYDIFTWKNFFKYMDNHLTGDKKKIYTLLNQEMELESIITLKNIKNSLKGELLLNDSDLINNYSNLYINDQTNVIKNLENMQDLVLFLGSNLRLESSILNAKVRFKYRNEFLQNVAINNSSDFNMPCHFLSLNTKNLISAFEGRCTVLSSLLINSFNTYAFVGDNLASRTLNIDSLLKNIKTKFPNFNIIYVYLSSNSEGLKWLNIKKQKPSQKNENTLCFAINPKENYLTKKNILPNKMSNTFITSHGSSSTLKAAHILPTKTAFESSYKYLNYEHRAQKTNEVVKNVSEARDVGKIFLSIFNKKSLKLEGKKWFSHIEENISCPEKYSTLELTLLKGLILNANRSSSKTKISNYPLKEKVKNFYLYSRLSNFSKVMRECSKELHQSTINFYKLS